jgi:hypothetical protein
MSDNVIDATDFFTARKPAPLDVTTNLGVNKAFRSYCECVGLIVKDIISQSEFHDPHVEDQMFNFESSALIDVSMNQPVTIAAAALAEEIMAECRASGIKVYIDSIVFRKIVIGTPEKISLTMRMGSRNG